MSGLPAHVLERLQNFDQDMVDLMKSVAPEKATQVDAHIRRFNVIFERDDQAARIRFFTRPTRDQTSRIIGVGIRCLPRLWATAYAYLELYQVAADESAGRQEGGAVDIELAARPALDVARGLLTWATQNELKVRGDDARGGTLEGFEEHPPKELPEPYAPGLDGSTQHIATELSHIALAFILHHELAHIYCGHIGLNEDLVRWLKMRIRNEKRKKKAALERELEWEYSGHIQNEKQADTEAANWLLGNADTPDKLFKRSLGVAIALSWLAVSDAYIGPTNSPAYPPGYDRLYQTLMKYLDDPDHPTWAVTAFVLMLHLQNAGKWEPNPDGYTSFRAIASWGVDILARESRYSKEP